MRVPRKPPIQSTQMVILTNIAAEKVRAFMEGQSAEGEIGLRVGVRGGGCSGFQYALALDEKHDDDHVFDSSGIPVLVDPQRGRLVRLRFLVPRGGRGAELRRLGVAGPYAGVLSSELQR